MTTTLTHPDPEDLSRFVEGTLEGPELAAVVEHVADCDECRIIVVDATEFIDPTAFDKKLAVGQSAASGRWWVAAAAAVAIAVGGVWIVDARRDPLAPVKEASAGLPSRPVEARLSGFQYVAVHTMRGGGQETEDPATFSVEGEVAKVLERQGSSAKTLHAQGVAHLLAAGLRKVDQSNDADRQADVEAIKSDRAKAVEALRAAVAAAPDNVTYQSDLAAALIATGESENLHLAVAACDQAINFDPGSREALFNRAIALRDLHDGRATEAFKRYLKVDPSSRWAEEATQQIDRLK